MKPAKDSTETKRTSYKRTLRLRQPTNEVIIAKKSSQGRESQLCPQFRALGEFSGKIKVASDDELGKDTMLLESKLQKYKCRH